MTQCKTARVDVLTASRLEKNQQRQIALETSGYWPRFKLEVFLNRSRPTINQWDSLLLSFIPDYAKYWPGERKPLTDYHRFCLQKINNFQSKEKPYKALGDLVSFIQRNIESFSIQSYIKHYSH